MESRGVAAGTGSYNAPLSLSQGFSLLSSTECAATGRHPAGVKVQSRVKMLPQTDCGARQTRRLIYIWCDPSILLSMFSRPPFSFYLYVSKMSGAGHAFFRHTLCVSQAGRISCT